MCQTRYTKFTRGSTLESGPLSLMSVVSILPKFKCSFCEKMLKTEVGLIVHEREHTGERPFKCDVCGQHFAYRGLMGATYPLANSRKRNPQEIPAFSNPYERGPHPKGDEVFYNYSYSNSNGKFTC